MSENKEVTLETLKRFHDKRWDWFKLSENESFSWSWVKEFPHKPWNWRTLSLKIVSIKTVIDFPDKPWDWVILTFHDKIKFIDMAHNPHLPWVIQELFFADKITDDEITFLRTFRYHYTQEDMRDHSFHVSFDKAFENPDLNWAYDVVIIDKEIDTITKVLFALSKGIGINKLSKSTSFAVIEMLGDVQWNYDIVSRRANESDVKKFPGITKWNLNFVSFCEFEPRKWFSARKIQRQFRVSISDPQYHMCTSRLSFEIKNLGEIK